MANTGAPVNKLRVVVLREQDGGGDRVPAP